MLEKIKKALRISNDIFNDEIQDLIDSALTDLELSGVVSFTETDPLIIRAVTIYCKAHFGFNDNSERFQQSYDLLKTHLSLSGDYNASV